jgi:hypothetical protein
MIGKSSGWSWLVCGVERHIQHYFSNILAVSFIGGGNPSTRRKPPTMGKQLVNLYHLRLRVECTLCCNLHSRVRSHAVPVLVSWKGGLECFTYSKGLCTISGCCLSLLRILQFMFSNLIQLSMLIIISLKTSLFSPWFSWEIANLALNNNHSLNWIPV